MANYIVLNSYWDILPIDIQDIIYKFKDEILLEERNIIIKSLTMDELINELVIKNRLDVKQHIYINAIKTDNNIITIKSYTYNDILDAINLGINLHRRSSITNNEVCQTVIHYDSLDIDVQYNLAIDCFNELSIDKFISVIGSNEEFVNLADWCYNYLKDKWGYPD